MVLIKLNGNLTISVRNSVFKNLQYPELLIRILIFMDYDKQAGRFQAEQSQSNVFFVLRIFTAYTIL